MQKYWRFFYFSILISVLFTSCDSKLDKEQIPDVSDVEVDIKFRRLEQEIFALKSIEEVASFIQKNPQLDKAYFRKFTPIDPAKEPQLLWDFINYEANDTLYQDTEKVFGDLPAIREEFEQAFKFVKYYYPDFKIPEIYTMISGFGHFGFGGDVIDCGDFIVIGLDYFGGEKMSYRPPEIPQYIAKRYSPEYIVPTVMLIVSAKLNKVGGKAPNMLSEMISYGKSYEFVNKVLPTAPDSVIWGWTQEEIAGTYHNEGKIWSHFVEHDLFYETNSFKKNKYLGERPAVLEIDKKCPGRIGRWLGWRVVRQYMLKHPELSLQDLMNTENTQTIFQKSKYRPPVNN